MGISGNSSFVFFVNYIGNGFINYIAEIGVQQTFFGLNLFLEILVFLVFLTFVVFGIKGFFEKYSHKFANLIIFISGVLLAVLIFVLSYQVLLIE